MIPSAGNPRRIKDNGRIRPQFHHVIDIAPTILEAAGIPQPVEVNGAWQKPIEGVSMAYSFDQASAGSARRTLYFEIFGSRALDHHGWPAAAFHGRAPWEPVVPRPGNFAADRWELYILEEDFSEVDDLAARNPRRLKELQELFWVGAAKNQVLPLDDRLAERMDPAARPSLIAGRTSFTYFGGAYRIPESSAANVKNAVGDYKAPFPFSGTLEKVVIDTSGAKLSDADVKELRRLEGLATRANE